TQAARAVLPPQYTRHDAVFNVQRVALFLAALQEKRLDLISEAMRDRFHQPYRAALIPGLEDALALEGIPGLLGVALSGAGPTVIAFCQGDSAPSANAIVECFRDKGVSATARPLAVDHRGLVVEQGR